MSEYNQPGKEIIAGLAGLVTGFISVACMGVLTLPTLGVADPSLIGALAPLILVFFLIVGGCVALGNGILWFVLVRKKGRGAIGWMLLSLVGSFVSPWIVLAGIAIITRAPSMELPDTNELIGCCGVPGAIIGLLLIAFFVTRFKPKVENNLEKESLTDEPDRNQETEIETSIEASNSRKGVVTFILGVTISTLSAGLTAALFYLAIFFIVGAEAEGAPSTGGFVISMGGLLSILYSLLSLIASLLITLVVSLTLTIKLISPKMPTQATRIVTIVLFTLLSLILNLSLDTAIFLILTAKSYPY